MQAIRFFRGHSAPGAVPLALMGLVCSLLQGANAQSVGVGFHLVDLPEGTSLVANPFQSEANLVSSLFEDVPDGFTVSKLIDGQWQGSTWSAQDSTWSLPSLSLTPGEGARVDSPAPYQWFTSGKPLIGQLKNWIPAGGSARGSRLAVAGLLVSELGFVAPENTTLSTLDLQGNTVDLGVYIDDTTGWLWSGGEEPTVGMGQGFIIQSAAAFQWSQSFEVEGLVNPISFVQEPADQTLDEGSELVLQAEASGLEGLLFQWQKDGVDIPGAHEPVFSIAEVSVADSGHYAVLAYAAGFSQRSAHAAVSVESKQVEPPTSPEVTSRLSEDGSMIEVTVSGTVGQVYTVQGSIDFINWAKRKSGLVNETGSVTYSERIARGRARFYRAQVEE